MREILGKAKTIRELLSGAKYSIDERLALFRRIFWCVEQFD